jgi:hypothetical protein
MYLYQSETLVQKDTDNFTEKEEKVCDMQLKILQQYSDHELTTLTRVLGSLFFGFPLQDFTALYGTEIFITLFTRACHCSIVLSIFIKFLPE